MAGIEDRRIRTGKAVESGRTVSVVTSRAAARRRWPLCGDRTSPQCGCDDAMDACLVRRASCVSARPRAHLSKLRRYAIQRGAERVESDRLLQPDVGFAGPGAGVVFLDQTAHHDDFDLAVARAEVLRDREAVELRHDNVEQDDLGAIRQELV